MIVIYKDNGLTLQVVCHWIMIMFMMMMTTMQMAWLYTGAQVGSLATGLLTVIHLYSPTYTLVPMVMMMNILMRKSGHENEAQSLCRWKYGFSFPWDEPLFSYRDKHILPQNVILSTFLAPWWAKDLSSQPSSFLWFSVGRNLCLLCKSASPAACWLINWCIVW